ncbi:MAG: BglG family transcription antiterminator [Erysipelotrichaceae bacterium]|nr:BglG family transcription antiterminator [Lachnospiraceae bacterium]MCI6846094.1 BglG family transcription antiterminator [Solobacterium sp.]MDY4791561.1 BglG family transcription antiterminator [Erysipelotrichaceae bacterium]
MNIRQKYELSILIKDGKFNLDKLAETFNVNARTIRNDIVQIDDYLKNKNVKATIEVKNKIITINMLKDIKLEDLVEINYHDFYSDRISNEERILLILSDLCWSDGYLTIQDLADKYFVSRGTINSDIVSIKEYCDKNGINFVSARGKGIGIDEDEKNRRKYLASIIKEFAYLNQKVNLDMSIYGQWFDLDEINKIQAIVNEVDEIFNVSLTDVAYEALIVHIALSIERFKAGNNDEELPSEELENIDSLQYKIASTLVEMINEEFNISLGENEIYYIAVHTAAKSGVIVAQEKRGDNFLEYYCLRLINNVGLLLNVDLSNDKHLFNSLFQHLCACEYRNRNNISLDNPLKDELKNNYKDLFEIVKAVIIDVNEPDVIIPSDDEIAYVMLHFCTAIKRDIKQIKPLRVLVVCATGIGTAELLSLGLKENFNFEIVDKLAKHQLKDEKYLNDVDLIISTVPLKSRIPSVVVSPILKEKDIIDIKHFINRLDLVGKLDIKSTKMSKTAVMLKDLLNKYPSNKDEEILIEKIKTLLLNEKGEENYMLSDLIRKETIALGLEVDDWQDAVRKAGQLLINDGSITEEYIDGAIENVKELGPYIVITKGIALPHATNKVGVNRTAMSLITLKNPVNFGNKNNDPVDTVFMLATTDSTSHLGALQDLSEFLGDEEFLNILRHDTTIEKILAFIATNEIKKGGK